MNYYAHSPKDGIGAQTYAAHITGVRLLASEFANEVGTFAKRDAVILKELANNCAEYHDLGKLDEQNQQVLSGRKKADRLPINHTDAGAAHFLQDQYSKISSAPIVALTIRSHHIGFPDFSTESNKGNECFRDPTVAAKVNRTLPLYDTIHTQLMGTSCKLQCEDRVAGDLSVFLRMLLSCVADADHTDTARHYGKYPQKEKRVQLRAEERLARLDECIVALQQTNDKTERNTLRGEMYFSCRNAEIDVGISSCDSPVGSGKTTAIMAHLLVQAQKRKLRRIFVVLPFTNIIQQSVKKYREVLTLPGENPEDVVAELHHRADFESEDARHLTALWRAPIIVTTAVAFFETLASNSTATLRRIHELPGSAIFVDESHAALPVSLLPLAWKWMKVYSDEWSCYWVLASGTMCRFWTIREIGGKEEKRDVPEIIDETLRRKLSFYESDRVSYQTELPPKSAEELIQWISSFPGPRLVILNTVQSAAILANFFAQKQGRDNVEHLSTALIPNDRNTTLKRIKDRLSDKSDEDWTLIATSCVEAGMDFSFRTGFRELASLSSLLQIAGRIDREGIYQASELWTFQIKENDQLKRNPGLEQAGKVLKRYLENGMTPSPQMATQAISDEICLYGIDKKHETLFNLEACREFKRVENGFRVIDSDTRLAIIDCDRVRQLRNGKINWRELQKVSVQIATYKLDELRMERIIDDIYYWSLEYDSFLGYMAGIVKLKEMSNGVLIV